MSWVAVQSSQIHSIRFDPIDQTLDARFLCKCKGLNASCETCNGQGHSSEYRYHAVPSEVHAMVRDAESIGAMFNKLVKRGEHIDPPAPFKFSRVR